MVGNASKSIVRIFGKVEPGDLPASSQFNSTTDKLDITTRVTAANLRGEIKESASVDVQLEAVRVEELVDILAFKFRVDFPMRQRCREELEAENWKWFREVY